MKRLTAILLTLFFVFLTSSCSDLTWSKKSNVSKDWEGAQLYCANLSEDGSSDWRLPTISELRTLIRNCSSTEAGGRCEVDDDCLVTECRTDKDCSGCAEDESGKYSLFDDFEGLWSSSPVNDKSSKAWAVYFTRGSVRAVDSSDSRLYIRCVR